MFTRNVARWPTTTGFVRPCAHSLATYLTPPARTCRGASLGFCVLVHENTDRSLDCSLSVRPLVALLTEERDMARGSLDLAAMARRRLVALWGGPVLTAMDDPMRIAIADVVIEAMASQLVFEATLAAKGRELPAGTGSVAIRARLADAVQELGNDEVFDLIADALRDAGTPDPVAELREDLGLR